MKKYLSKFLSITAFIIQCTLFLPDFILYLSWKNEKNFYKIIPFLKEKSYINPEDFLNSATIMVINWHHISLILFLLIFITIIIDIIKNKALANIIFNISLLILSFIIMIIIFKHHKIINFYFDPANDLPWDYRNI